ncbi:hypothetical protein FQN60_007417, partial [Etheostoma spectabile]
SRSKQKLLPLWSPCLQEESQILPTRTTKRQVTKKTSPSQCPVRLIMKSSDVSSINQDALFLTTKATELFVQHLALASFNGPGKKPTLYRTATWLKPRRGEGGFPLSYRYPPKKILARDFLQSLDQMQDDDDADF